MVPICCAFLMIIQIPTNTKFYTTLHIWNVLIDLNNAFIYQQEISLFKSKDVGKNTDSITKHMNNPVICVFCKRSIIIQKVT